MNTDEESNIVDKCLTAIVFVMALTGLVYLYSILTTISKPIGVADYGAMIGGLILEAMLVNALFTSRILDTNRDIMRMLEEASEKKNIKGAKK